MGWYHTLVGCIVLSLVVGHGMVMAGGKGGGVNWKAEEERAKRLAGKRLNLPEPKGVTTVDPEDFGVGHMNNKALLKECWWETLPTKAISAFFQRDDVDASRANCISQYSETAAHYCLRPGEGDWDDCISAVLQVDGIDLNVRDEHGCTPLVWAVHNDFLDAAKQLIEALDYEKSSEFHVDNFVDYSGKTLLDHASTDAMRKLLHDWKDGNHENKGKRPKRKPLDTSHGLVPLAANNWDEEVNVKLQVDRKSSMFLFVGNLNDPETRAAAKAVSNVSKDFPEIRAFIMNAVANEPPRPFGKQPTLPSVYVRASSGKKQVSKCEAAHDESSLKACIESHL